MSKYTQSKEAVDTSLLLWDIRPTQTTVQETYDLIVYPSAVYDDTFGGPINFTIPPQSNGCLVDIEILTEWQVKNGDVVLVADAQTSVINNIANAMWSFVDVLVGDRVNVMQSMENAYAYQTYFSTALNNSSLRKDYLAVSECFEMDEGDSKTEANCKVFFSADDAAFILNKGSAKRAKKVKLSRVVKTRAKLHTSLMAHSKVLPTQMRINVTLVKNRNNFLIQAAADGNKVVIKKLYLQCTFVRPRDSILNLQETRLMKSPALYDVEYPEISMRSIPQNMKQVTINDLFPNKLPKAAFFVIQNTSDIAGDRGTSPFSGNRVMSFQLYVNNHEHFPVPIKFDDDWKGLDDFSEAYVQLYKALGMGLEGNCLINRDNFNINYIIGVVLTPDKEHTKHLNLQSEADVRADITLEDQNAGPFTLITYALYDRLYQIDHNRKLTIIE